MSRLGKLRSMHASSHSPEFEAAVTSLCWLAPAWFAAHGLAGGGWGWAVVAALVGTPATFLGFILAGAALASLVGRRVAEVGGLIVVLAAATWWWCLPRYGELGFVPAGVAAATFVLARLRRRRTTSIPGAVVELFASLPEKLPADVANAIERALHDVEQLEETLGDLRADPEVDAAALRADVLAALRAIAERARLSGRLASAPDRDRPRLTAAAAEAADAIEALAAQVRAASEALLLYAAARQPAGAAELRERAEALRATTAGLREIAALEAGR